MTLGWHVRTVDGAPVFYKEGGGGGFRSLMRLCPAAGFGSVIMSNATNLAVWPCLDQAERLLLDQDLTVRSSVGTSATRY